MMKQMRRATRVSLLASLALWCTTSWAVAAIEVAAPVPHRAAVETLASRLAARFVDPATGARYAAMLRANVAAGRYDTLAADKAALAATLTGDLQAVARDGHLRVDLAPTDPPAAPSPGAKGGPVAASRPGLGPIDLPSVAETKWIGNDVAYIRFNQFAGEPGSAAAVDAFMRDHATARAIVIDTRTVVRGGGLAEMDALFPYLFDRETVLVEMAVARSVVGDGPAPMAGPTMREVSSRDEALLRRQHVAIPHASEHRLFDAQVFFLASKRTRSAGEHFALALKRTHRGTLVGEATAGANHFGGVEPIGDGLVAFIPVGRTYDPDTGIDWEGVGVAPDIAVPVDDALARALSLVER